MENEEQKNEGSWLKKISKPCWFMVITVPLLSGAFMGAFGMHGCQKISQPTISAQQSVMQQSFKQPPATQFAVSSLATQPSVLQQSALQQAITQQVISQQVIAQQIPAEQNEIKIELKAIEELYRQRYEDLRQFVFLSLAAMSIIFVVVSVLATFITVQETKDSRGIQQKLQDLAASKEKIFNAIRRQEENQKDLIEKTKDEMETAKKGILDEVAKSLTGKTHTAEKAVDDAKSQTLFEIARVYYRMAVTEAGNWNSRLIFLMTGMDILLSVYKATAAQTQQCIATLLLKMREDISLEPGQLPIMVDQKKWNEMTEEKRKTLVHEYWWNQIALCISGLSENGQNFITRVKERGYKDAETLQFIQIVEPSQS